MSNERLSASVRLNNELAAAAAHLARVFADAQVCASHGVDHALAVLKHAQRALDATERPALLSADQWARERRAVELAALLHDADDAKFFAARPLAGASYPNARAILAGLGAGPELAELVVLMVGWVSCSAWGDAAPAGAAAAPWRLIVRHADRLESIGWVGAARCWAYTLTVGRPLFTADTLRARDEADLWARVAPAERFLAYRGQSASMLDHYADKLLHLCAGPTGNAYLDGVALRRRRVLVEIALEFGRTGVLEPDAPELAAAEAAAEAAA